jgi:hypothetical protein
LNLKVGFIQSKDYYAYQIINLNEINKENNKGSIVLQGFRILLIYQMQ